MTEKYDIIIIGGGPAGLSAAIYAGRAKMKTLVIEHAAVGGQITTTSEIANYPGSLAEESGVSLTERMEEQAKKFGAEFAYEDVVSVDLSGKEKKVSCENSSFTSKALIIASGASPKHLGVPGEEEFTGMGVSYCASCDGAFFEGLPIYVAGGGDSAAEEAMFLTRFSDRVTLVHRRDSLRAAKSIQEKAFAANGLSIRLNTKIAEIGGNDAVQRIILEDTITGERETIESGKDPMMGVFIFVGLNPNSELYPAEIKNENGYIITDEEMRTSISGVFAAGDIRVKSLRQVVTAAADGAIAAVSAAKYCEE